MLGRNLAGGKRAVLDLPFASLHDKLVDEFQAAEVNLLQELALGKLWLLGIAPSRQERQTKVSQRVMVGRCFLFIGEIAFIFVRPLRTAPH